MAEIAVNLNAALLRHHAAERPDDACLLTDEHKRFGKYTIVRRGKRNHALLVWK